MKTQRLWLILGVVLAAVACLNAAYIDSGTLIVSSDDLIADQTDGTRSGFDFSWSYSGVGNGYRQNLHYYTETPSATISGWENGIYANENAERNSGAYRPFMATAVSTTGYIMWSFDFSQTGQVIDALQIHSYRDVASGDASVSWSISEDGTSWSDIVTTTASGVTLGDGVTLADEYYDVSSLIKDASGYFLKLTIVSDDADLWRAKAVYDNSGTPTNWYSLDNEVWLTTAPEPTTLALLGIGLVGLVSKKRKF